MIRSFGVALVAALGFSLTGCGTVMNFMEPGTAGLPENAGEKSIYGGIGCDIELISSSEWFWEKMKALILAGLIDLPLSFVMDTVTLPITITMTVTREP